MGRHALTLTLRQLLTLVPKLNSKPTLNPTLTLTLALTLTLYQAICNAEAGHCAHLASTQHVWAVCPPEAYLTLTLTPSTPSNRLFTLW